MAHYPFRHSTYYTRDDAEFISELPPMNSNEDLLQELQTYGRDHSYPMTTRSSYSRPSRPTFTLPASASTPKREHLVSRVFRMLKTKVKVGLKTVKNTSRRRFRR